jgi:hypothetical protein
MKDLKNLPSCVSHHFLALSKLAYVGICEKSQQVDFSEEEVPSDLDCLGLMQSSVELHIDVGAEKSYSFHHLTIQEFLAAHHISTLSETEQLEHFEGKMQMVTTFLAGLSPSLFKKSLTPMLLMPPNTDIHKLFEAKIEPPHDCSAIVSDPFISYMLGCLIASTSCHWEVTIIDDIKMFVCGCISEEEPLKATLDLILSSLIPGSEDAVTKFCNVPFTVEHLQFHFDASLFFDSLSNSGKLHIKHLTIRCYHVANEAAKSLKQYLTGTSDVKHLTLTNVNEQAAATIMEGVQACRNLENFELKYSTIAVIGRIFCEALQDNTTWKALTLCSCFITSEGACLIAQATNTLEVLDISRNDIGVDGAVALADMLKANTTMKELNIAIWQSYWRSHYACN